MSNFLKNTLDQSEAEVTDATPAGLQGFRLSPQQRRVWSLQKARGGAALAARLTALIEGDLDRAAIERAVEAVTARHEVLRTSFRCPPSMSVPVQIVEDAAVALRVEIADAGTGVHLLTLELPALCADAASLEQLAAEIASVCAGSEAEGEVLQYPDFAEWQNTLLEGEETESGRAFWRGRPVPPPLRLPFVAEGRPFEPASLPVSLDAGTAARIERLAQSLNASPAAVLLAAWQALLHRFSTQEELTVGVLAEGRSYEGLESAVGLLAKYLPLVGRVDASTPFREAVARAAEALEEAAAWQEFFDWRLLAGGHQPLLAGFDFAERRPACEENGVRVSVLGLEAPGEPFAVKLSASRREEGGLALDLFYDAGAVPEEEACQLVTALRALLAAAVAAPAEPVGRLGLTEGDERADVIAGAAGPEGRWGSGCIHRLIEAVAAELPESAAAVHEDLQLTYGELHARATELAHRLRAAGVGPDSIVAIGLERSLETVVAILGTFQAGGAYLPLDPGLPAERRAFMLEDSGAVAVVTLEALREGLPAGRTEVICLDGPPSGPHGAFPVQEVAPENLAYVLYTSGSSGAPKAVQVEHRQLWNYVHAVLDVLDIPRGASWAMVSTFAADLGNTALFPALCTGGVLHMVAQERSADAHALAECFASRGIDVLKIVPSHLEALLAASPDPRLLMPRRCLVLGGEACRWEWIDRLSALAPGCRIVNHYGPTETTVGTSTFPLGRDGGRWSASPPIGRPLANARIHLLDPGLEPVPGWVPAELYVGGAGVSRGYLGRPDLTAERYLPDPLARVPGERLYRTGDLARRLPGGSLEFLGRADDQVKIRGYRIELGEVASVLERHPAVSRAEVLARDGEGQRRLVAWVAVRRAAAEPSAADLRAFLRERLPEFMVPAAFVVLDVLPLTPNGKVDRRALPEPREERASRGGQTAPRNTVEARLLEVWKAVLGVADIGVDDNFFALGGDSILGIQVVARARQERLVLQPADLFRHQTVAELALVAGTDGAAIVAPQGPVIGPVELTPIQRRFFELDLAEPHHWNQSVLLETRRRLEPPLVAAALAQLLDHHDALRLRFERRDEGWHQECAAPEGPAPLTWVDLSGVPDRELRPAIEAAAAQAQTSLDLSRGPLLRAVVLDLGPSRPGRLLLVAHHLVVDGVSWRVLLEDLGTAYAQAGAGALPRLPPKSSSYQQWSERLQAHAREPETAAELEFWLEQDGRGLAPLPRDAEAGLPDLPDVEGRAGRVSVTLGAEATEALLREVPEAYQSQIQEALLTALARALGRWTGSSALLVELEGHGREDLFPDLDLSRTVGWFTSRFPVVLDLGGTSTPGEALKSVKEQLRRLPRRGIGYGLLRYLGAAAAHDLRAQPAPEVGFNYLGQFDQVVSSESLFGGARESTGPTRCPSAPRAHLLQIDAGIDAGELQVTWGYSPARHRRETVERLAQGFLDELQALIDHCRSPEAGGYTPSDFPDLELSQMDLDGILDQVVGG